MEVWITYHALVAGIIKTDALPNRLGSIMYNSGVYTRNEWHKTFSAAKAQAEKMRLNKMTELKKEYNRLKALRFEEPDGNK